MQRDQNPSQPQRALENTAASPGGAGRGATSIHIYTAEQQRGGEHRSCVLSNGKTGKASPRGLTRGGKGGKGKEAPSITARVVCHNWDRLGKDQQEHSPGHRPARSPLPPPEGKGLPQPQSRSWRFPLPCKARQTPAKPLSANASSLQTPQADSAPKSCTKNSRLFLF